LPAFPSAWFVLPAQLLHGVTFGLYWSVGNAYVHEVAPVGCNAAVMGVFGGFVSLGGFSGAFFGGLVFKRVGGGVLFGLLGCVNGALTAAMTWHIRRRGRGRGRGGGVGVGVGGGYVAVGEDG
jgi:predicted MFS family arabinose efflux permease